MEFPNSYKIEQSILWVQWVDLNECVFSVNLVCKEELNRMLKVIGLQVKVRWV